MAKASVTVDVVCPDAAEVSGIMYEIAGHFGKLGHLYGKLAEIAERGEAIRESDAKRTDDNATAETG